MSTTTTAPVRFETSTFTRSHMRAPRGFGSWAFAFGTEGGEPWFTHAMTFTEARRAATVEARRRGVSLVFVLP